MFCTIMFNFLYIFIMLMYYCYVCSVYSVSLCSLYCLCDCVQYCCQWVQLTNISSVYVSVCAVIGQNVLEYYGYLKDKVCTHF